MKISICIPTYNRSKHLANCLQSIITNRSRSIIDFEVCVSDNCSTDETEDVIRRVQSRIPIKYQRNATNFGIARNFLNAVEMAAGEFVWLIGDDDLLLPHALEDICELLGVHKDVDFFYVNSFHLKAEYVLSFPQPFDTANLPENMTPFSSWPNSGEMNFMDLINPKISFDFLGGMYLSVFRRRNWIENVNALDETAVLDSRIFSHLDNTFPHVKIFSQAFAGSRAYFSSQALSVCLTGAREWAPMYPLVHSVRIVEALNEYRKHGLPYIRYFQCKNYALSKFVPHFMSMLINKDCSGFIYINPLRLIIRNCLYPNFVLSFVKYLLGKAKLILINNHNSWYRLIVLARKKY